MKKLLSAAFLAFALLTGNAHAAVEIGKPAPDYSFKDVNGKDWSIAKLKGKTIVLEWTNPGCPFVQAFYKSGEMQRQQQKAIGDSNLVWISINSSAQGKEGAIDAQQAKDWMTEQQSHASAYVLDPTGAFGKAYGAKTTPHVFVIDKNGLVQYQGAINSIRSLEPEDIKKADNYVLDTLLALKKGTAPKVTSTQSYGCSVKYAD
jgi:peroxiredoxin